MNSFFNSICGVFDFEEPEKYFGGVVSLIEILTLLEGELAKFGLFHECVRCRCECWECSSERGVDFEWIGSLSEEYFLALLEGDFSKMKIGEMKDIMSFFEYVLLYTFGVQYDCVGCFHSKDTCREKRVVVLDKCIICLEEHDVNTMTQPDDCKCKYHSCDTCMAEWLARNPSCPMCRKPMGEGFEREWDSLSYGSYDREPDDSDILVLGLRSEERRAHHIENGFAEDYTHHLYTRMQDLYDQVNALRVENGKKAQEMLDTRVDYRVSLLGANYRYLQLMAEGRDVEIRELMDTISRIRTELEYREETPCDCDNNGHYIFRYEGCKGDAECCGDCYCREGGCRVFDSHYECESDCDCMECHHNLLLSLIENLR